jgi:hypothetical protein
MLKNRIGGNGGSMQKMVDIARRDIESIAQISNSRADAVGRIVWCGGHFIHFSSPSLCISEYNVCERSADINTN